MTLFGPSVAREFTPSYDNGVDPDAVHRMMTRAVAFGAEAVGPIIFEPPILTPTQYGLEVPIDTTQEELRLPAKGEHLMFFTRRPIRRITELGHTRFIEGTTKRYMSSSVDGEIFASRAIVQMSADGEYSESSACVTVHEMTHTLINDRHCLNSDCIMQVHVTDKFAADLMNRDRTPFCNDCFSGLHRAGYTLRRAHRKYARSGKKYG